MLVIYLLSVVAVFVGALIHLSGDFDITVGDTVFVACVATLWPAILIYCAVEELGEFAAFRADSLSSTVVFRKRKR